MAQKWIYWFEELSSDHNDLVGKKCANLGETDPARNAGSAGICRIGRRVREVHGGKWRGEEIRRYVHEQARAS